MNPIRRELIHRVADGYNKNYQVLHHIDGFVHAERMYKWLIAHKITGKNFWEFYSKTFKYSWLTLGKWLVMKINKEAELARVVAGRDYVK